MNYMNYGAPAQQQQVASNAYTPEPQQMASTLPFQNPQRSSAGGGMMHATVMPTMWGGGNPFTVADPTVGNALLSQEYGNPMAGTAATATAIPSGNPMAGTAPMATATPLGNPMAGTAPMATAVTPSVNPMDSYTAPTPSGGGNPMAGTAPTAIATPTPPTTSGNPMAGTSPMATAVPAGNPMAGTAATATAAPAAAPATSVNPMVNAPTVSPTTTNPMVTAPTVNPHTPTPSTSTGNPMAGTAPTATAIPSGNPMAGTAPTATAVATPPVTTGNPMEGTAATATALPTGNPMEGTAPMATAVDGFAPDTSGQPTGDPMPGRDPTAIATGDPMPGRDPTATATQTQQTQQVASNAYDPTATVDNSAAANAYAQQQQQNFNQQQSTDPRGPGIDPLIDATRYGESTALAMDPILDYTARLEEPLINELESNLGTPNYNFTEAGNNSLLNSLERQYRYDGAGALGKTALTQDPGNLQSALLNNANRIDDANPYDTRRDEIIGGKDSEVDRMYDKEFERIQNQFAVNNNLGSPAYTQALQDMNDQKAQAKLGIRSEFGQTAAAQDESMASGRLADVTGAIGTSRSGQISEEAIQANRRAGAQATGGYMGTTEFDQDLRGSALEEGVRRGRAHDVGQGLERERGHVDRQMGYQQQLQQQANDDYYRNLKAEEDAMYRPFQYQDAGMALGGGALASPGTDMSTAMQGYGNAGEQYAKYGQNRANQIATNAQAVFESVYN